ncbi:MAG: SDR family NAD(P)-dependent oxidoreductase [Rhodospirillum sp.]|nr:SDR family NAD(P)-dependent oxidoreductase [Rhodospirillum sp.]MCF8489210.1 SDR family NAD(P)-dependent oxidoreductase [Rhodospirillum sp.]MCF8500001.1 SDR family NAD(P)-dependent oxidoreductase [Rhodospirillum sp.]
MDHAVALSHGDPMDPTAAKALVDLPIWDDATLDAIASLLGLPPDGDWARGAAPRAAERTLAPTCLVPDLGNTPALAPSPARDVAPMEREEIGKPLSDRPALSEAPPYTPPSGHPRTLGEALDRAAVGDRGVVHVADDGAEWRETYADLRLRALSILGLARAKGIGAGDILLIDARESIPYLGALWACLLGGMVAAPLALPEADAATSAFDRLRQAVEVLGRPRILTTETRRAALAARADLADLDVIGIPDTPDATLALPRAVPSPHTDPESVPLILLTSGSTGAPKGVRQTHRAILAMAGAAAMDAIDLGQNDIFLNWMPYDHVGATAFLILAPAILAAEQVQANTAPILADPTRWLDLVSRHRITINWAPNFAFGLIADAVEQADSHPWDLSRLRRLINGGEAVTEGSLRAFLDRLAPLGLPGDALCPAMGMSETCAPSTLAHLGQSRGSFASLGRPVRGASLRIVGEDGTLLREGEVGRFQQRGPQLFVGYHNRDDLTAEAMDDGWFDTGDVGFLADGALYLTGRLKDSININGAKVFAHEIETSSARVPGLSTAALAAVPVRPAGASTDEVALFFSAPLAEGTEDDDILRVLTKAIRLRLARDLGIAINHPVLLPSEAFPRTSIGKIQRPLLRQRFEAGAYDTERERIAALSGGDARVGQPYRPVWVAKPLTDALPGPMPAAAPWDPARTVVVTTTPDSGGALAVLDRLLSLARANAVKPEGERISRVLVVTRGAVLARPYDSLDPDATLLPGLLRSLTLVLPGISWRLLDIDGPPDGPMEGEELAALVERERVALDEPLCAWRGGDRLVPRLDPVTPEAPSDPGPPLQPGAPWLVTGGLGGLGRLACERLLKRGASLLLTGRSPRADLPADRAAALQRLEALGPIRYLAVDVADAQAMGQAVSTFEAETGEPLDGILHLAALGAPLPLLEDDGTALSALRRASLDGLRVLSDLLPPRARTRLLVAGSITGHTGGRMAAYGAVSAAAATQCAALVAQGWPVTHLAFSSWSGVGLSAGNTNDALLRLDGLRSLDANHGLAMIEAALWRPLGCLLVGLNGDHPLHAARVLGSPAPLTRPVLWWVPGAVRGDATGMEPGVARVADALGRPAWVYTRPVREILRRPDGAPDPVRLALETEDRRVAPRDETERLVARIVAEVLEGAPPAIGDDFFLLGGTSLLAARLAARLGKRFYVPLSSTVAFQYPTVEALTRHLRAIEPKPGLVDAVARKLADLEALSPEDRAALATRKTLPK